MLCGVRGLFQIIGVAVEHASSGRIAPYLMRTVPAPEHALPDPFWHSPTLAERGLKTYLK